MSWRAQSHPPTSAAPLAGGSRHGGACSESSVEGHAARTAAWEIQQRLRWRAGHHEGFNSRRAYNNLKTGYKSTCPLLPHTHRNRRRQRGGDTEFRTFHAFQPHPDQGS